MMSAEDYSARADAMVGAADRCSRYDLILEFEATARAWRTLADLAACQDEILASLAALGVTPIPAARGDL